MGFGPRKATEISFPVTCFGVTCSPEKPCAQFAVQSRVFLTDSVHSVERSTPIRFVQPCRQSLSWVSARPAAVGRGEGSPFVLTSAPPPARPRLPRAYDGLRSVVPVSSELERCERVSAHSTPRGRSRGGVEATEFERRSLPDSGRGRARHRSRKRCLLWGVWESAERIGRGAANT